jgi:2-polyprenyl-6-methoxyphenol hydroxylase-like FAD-dependent oxidoreductase
MAFKVLIAGGSISGLTLALIFERYGIDYLLLEKHAEIAPFLGTTVGINPNGARILDQLGVYSELDKLGAKLDTNYYYDWQGKLLAAQKPINLLMKWLLVNRKNIAFLSTTKTLLTRELMHQSWI